MPQKCPPLPPSNRRSEFRDERLQLHFLPCSCPSFSNSFLPGRAALKTRPRRTQSFTAIIDVEDPIFRLCRQQASPQFPPVGLRWRQRPPPSQPPNPLPAHRIRRRVTASLLESQLEYGASSGCQSSAINPSTLVNSRKFPVMTASPVLRA